MRAIGFVLDDHPLFATSSIRLAPITIVFGRTGSGKSLLLEALAEALEGGAASRVRSYGTLFFEQSCPEDTLEFRQLVTQLIEKRPGPPVDWPCHPPYEPKEYPEWGEDLDAAEAVPEVLVEPDELRAARTSADRDAAAIEVARQDWFMDGARWSEAVTSRLSEPVPQDLADDAHRFASAILQQGLLWSRFYLVGWACDRAAFDTHTLTSVGRLSTGPEESLACELARQVETAPVDFVQLCEVESDDRGENYYFRHPQGALFTANPQDLEWHLSQSLSGRDEPDLHLERLRATLTAHLPPFVSRQGILSIRETHRSHYTHVVVEMVPHQSALPLGYSDLASGTREWVALAADLALNKVYTDASEQSSEEHFDDNSYGIPGPGSPVVLLDEPEAHLDPETQIETVRWINSLASPERRFVIATHSPIFINDAAEGARLYGTVRTGGRTELLPLDPDLLSLVEEHGRELGMGRAAALQMARTIVLVEGKHDLAVLRVQFADLLRSARALVVPLGGTGNAQTMLAESHFFSRLGARLLLLFDNVRAKNFVSGKLPLRGGSMEERIAAGLVARLQVEGITLSLLPFDQPDIICALPPAAIARAFPAVSVRWAPLIDEWRQRGGGNFKEFALRKIGLRDVGASEFVDAVLAAWRPEDGRDRGLEDALRSLSFDS